MSDQDKMDYEAMSIPNQHSDAVRAQEQALLAAEEWARARRAKACRDASAILYISSGVCSALGWYSLRAGDVLTSLFVMALAGVTVAVAGWCSRWSRQ